LSTRSTVEQLGAPNRANGETKRTRKQLRHKKHHEKTGAYKHHGETKSSTENTGAPLCHHGATGAAETPLKHSNHHGETGTPEAPWSNWSFIKACWSNWNTEVHGALEHQKRRGATEALEHHRATGTQEPPWSNWNAEAYGAIGAPGAI
jgi:hypothetical protein